MWLRGQEEEFRTGGSADDLYTPGQAHEDGRRNALGACCVQLLS